MFRKKKQNGFIGERTEQNGANVQIVRLPMVVWIHRTVLIVEEKWVDLKIVIKFKGYYYYYFVGSCNVE